MPTVRSNGIDIAYEELGTGHPLVLIMGLGAQLVHWHDDLCAELAAFGFRVLRFDNRDCGLSSKIEGSVGDIRRLIVRSVLGRPMHVPYTLSDMADDVAGMLDGLGIESAHVAGVSLGGMIAQTFAIQHPHRVRSLVSMMSTTGARRFMVAKPKALKLLFARVPPRREVVVEHAVDVFRTFSGPGFPFDAALVRDAAGRAFDRCFCPAGFKRQLAAIFASGDRTGALRFVRAPSLVLHGSHDPVILPAAGRATARAIPGATLRIVDGMGHSLPRGAWPLIARAIAENASIGEERLRRRKLLAAEALPPMKFVGTA